MKMIDTSERCFSDVRICENNEVIRQKYNKYIFAKNHLLLKDFKNRKSSIKIPMEPGT